MRNEANTCTTAAAYDAAAAFLKADSAWESQLLLTFGRRASEARYMPEGRGAAGSGLNRAYQARREALAAWESARAPGARTCIA